MMVGHFRYSAVVKLNEILRDSCVSVVRVRCPALDFSLIQDTDSSFSLCVPSDVSPVHARPNWSANCTLAPGGQSMWYLSCLHYLKALSTHTHSVCVCRCVWECEGLSKPWGQKCCDSSFDQAAQMWNFPRNVSLKCHLSWLVVKCSITVHLSVCSRSFQFTAIPDCFHFLPQWEIASLFF